MSGPSRTVVCSQNAHIVDFLCGKREELLLEGSKYADTVNKACNSLCDHPTAITTATEAKALKYDFLDYGQHVGPWMLKLLKPIFDGRDCAPPPQPALAGPAGTNVTGKKGKAKKSYCPGKNTATFALLITLLRARREGKDFMMKKQLIEETDKSCLSNKPIRANPVGFIGGGQPNMRERYSGWAGMTTLIQKSLVVKSSNPAKYKLTDQGMSLAQECMERAGLSPVKSSGHETAREEGLRVSPAEQESDEFSSGGQEASSSDDDIQEIRTSDLTQKNNYHFSSSRSGMGMGGLHSATLKLNLVGNASLQALPMATQTESAAKADKMHLARNNSVYRSVSATNGIAQNPEMKGLRQHTEPYGQKALFRLLSASQGNATVMGSVDPDLKLPVPPLKAGEKFSDVYEVICILDTREKFRGRAGAADSHLLKVAHTLKERFKLKVETRHLPVGDALWIARHKQQNEEYILDFVVERKDVHDLWSSIKDNRYKQQKLRLMNCGLKCLLYLVEGDVNQVEATESLKTAMFTTELQDGFRLLRTADEMDTCQQYGHLTLAIKRLYDQETGKGGNSDQVCKTYKAFVEHCKDFKKDRVKDVFCRQLTQISQVTEDIALSIQDRYPTLFSIAQAFTGLEGNQGAQEKMLQGLPIRNTSKTISAVMSKNIYKAMWAH